MTSVFETRNPLQGKANFPASKKVYVQGSRSDIQVPFRQISLTPTAGRFGQEANPPINLYDTSVGAHFLGMERLGLGAIAEEFLGVQLDKSKKLQRADWSLRPLSETAIDYARA